MSKPIIYIVYYSMYGHVEKLARNIKKGVEKSGAVCKLYQVEETLHNSILTKMHAPPKATDIPFISSDELAEADGILFGMPTRFGSAPAQMRALFDRCGHHWVAGGLYGKFAGTFFSTATLGGGQETTALSCMSFFAHLGMVFVPLGYKNPRIADISQVHGSSAWGAGSLAGSDNKREISDLELELAVTQGYEFGELLKRVNFPRKDNKS